MKRPLRVALFAGTRPEIIKLAPLMLAAQDRANIGARLISTGQQDHLLAGALTAFDLAADARIEIDWRTAPSRIGPRTRLLRDRAATFFATCPFDLAIVQGDTTTAYGVAQGARAAGTPIAHVEAGLRSGRCREPWPEEINRIGIDALADLLFAPTAAAADNLRNERVGGELHVTGNTGIDALLIMRDRLRSEPASSSLDRLLGGDRPFLLVTCHRRESFGEGVERICDALLAIADRGDVRLLLPLHSNPAIRVPIECRLGSHPAISLSAPLDYPTIVDAMARCRLILSDSGGIQEEAPALGAPVLVLRDVTERPEALATGNLRLVGTEPDRIAAEANRLLDDPAARAAMAIPAFPYGDGHAAARIWDAIQAWADRRAA